jgi:lipopolysaccharide biosynthesis glycosyltransferase
LASIAETWLRGLERGVVAGLAINELSPVPLHTVDIVFASDRAFIPFTAVAISSVLDNYRDPRPLRVFLLLTDPLTPLDRVRLRSLRRLHDFELVEIPVDVERFRVLNLPNERITVTTYARLVMHEVLPTCIDRIVFLDGDLVVVGNVAELYDLPLDGDALFAGVEDSLDRNELWGLPPGAPQINCGVLLANLSLMRSIDFSAQCSAWLANNAQELTLGDQQVIAAFHERNLRIDMRWNVHGKMWQPGWAKTRGLDQSLQEALMAKPAIIHYAGRFKPWLTGEHPASHAWWRYAATSPFAAELKSHRLPWWVRLRRWMKRTKRRIRPRKRALITI